LNEIRQELLTVEQSKIIEAMEANFAEEMACMARALPEGELHEEPDMYWFFTGRSGFNGVLRTTINSNDKSTIDARIKEVLAYFQARKVQIGWPIGPLAHPANLSSHLEAHGLTYRSSHYPMALDLLTRWGQVNIHVPGLNIEEIVDYETLKQWRSLAVIGFESSEEIGQTYYEAYSRVGFGEGYPWHHYIAWLHGRPVAIASLLLHAGVAGLYGITTHPDVRRKGIGTAITTYLLHDAQRFGYRVAILSPSEMGVNIYRHLGFQEYYKTDFYLWTPHK
jgi:GNAT superfamily N-acetyltransferase